MYDPKKMIYSHYGIRIASDLLREQFGFDDFIFKNWKKVRLTTYDKIRVELKILAPEKAVVPNELFGDLFILDPLGVQGFTCIA